MGGLSDVDAELFKKLSDFATAANRGDVSKALDAANLVFAHGMFKCGLRRTSNEHRAHILTTCAERFLGTPWHPPATLDILPLGCSHYNHFQTAQNGRWGFSYDVLQAPLKAVVNLLPRARKTGQRCALGNAISYTCRYIHFATALYFAPQ